VLSGSSSRLTVNGARVDVEVDARVTLLDLLREHLGLTGTKKGCDRGQCGACTVLIDGRRVNSCLVLALTTAGCEVTTVEGLASDGALAPLQQAFLDHDAYQCGYCTPGQLCSATAALAELRAGAPSAVTDAVSGMPHLSAEEVRERMSGNLCRCAAYPNIVDAILEVGA
jgi:xanthine dehydrogenase YagT iron-sulfur-binding subunit